MFEYLLVEHIWISLILWAIVYCTDYYLTIYSAHLYQSGLKEHIVFEGSFELTPYFQEDIDRLQYFSLRFMQALALSLIGIFLIWFLSVIVLNLSEPFLLTIGALFLREVAIHLRHSRNIALFRLAKQTGGLTGQVTYARPLTLKVSATELWSYAGLFLLLALTQGSWFFGGGVLSCLITGFQHWKLSRQEDTLQEEN